MNCLLAVIDSVVAGSRELEETDFVALGVAVPEEVQLVAAEVLVAAEAAVYSAARIFPLLLPTPGSYSNVMISLLHRPEGLACLLCAWLRVRWFLLKNQSCLQGSLYQLKGCFR